MLSSLLFTLLGVLLGGFPSWFFSRMYYLKSGTDIDTALRPIAGDAQRSLLAVTALGRMLEQSGLGNLTYDETGHITGIVVRTYASDVAIASDAALASIMPPSDVTTASEAAVITHIPDPLPQHDHQHGQPPAPDPESDHA
jgi:hypothetical protein